MLIAIVYLSFTFLSTLNKSAADNTFLFGPILLLLIAGYVFRKEWLSIDFNILKDRKILKSVYSGVQGILCIQALWTLFFGYSLNESETIIQRLPIFVLHVIITGPIIEEIIFRKFLFTIINIRSNFFISSLVSSILFSLAHYDTLRLIPYTITGIILCRVYLKTNSILPSILIHSIINLLAILAISIRQL
ncbi:CPBP family intramembrane glutamic endopeptidase [Paenibacillus mucilaginosus]|uniref:CPBP family intramembrane glutamic endopeptidase n=1 Tax=Paenibacillus mucilaginosus TaxID=61624 RepID=UPI003D20B4BF